MSVLRIVWSEDGTAESDGFAAEATVLPFQDTRAAAQRAQANVVHRARTLYSNRHCPVCSYPVVLPVELDDAAINRCGQAIPGTATLVGFRCRGCRAEWSV
jgi:hypothetical protein